ncbi:MAG: transglutaminase family protein [Gammaproteobacteria bacterium]|nr:transglutaminase family protein [Gammaproteobacteria bacterium]
MRLSIHHTTTYSYSEPQRMIEQSHRLYPSECQGQRLLSWDVEASGANFGSYFYDGAGDRIRTMSIAKTQSVEIQVTGEIETTDNNGVVINARDKVNPLVYLRTSEVTLPGDKLKAAALEAISSTNSTQLEQAHAMTGYINNAIAYASGATDNSYTAERALEQGSGVCQDQTHCLIAISRLNNIPARYVTGYLHTDAQGDSHDASHAWAELYIDDLGWVGFDPTNTCCPDDRYIRIGSGIDAWGAALIRGISRGVGQESMDVTVQINGMQQQ